MTFSRSLLTACLLGLSLLVGGCAGSSLEQALEADPQLANNPPLGNPTTGPEDAAAPTAAERPGTPTRPVILNEATETSLDDDTLAEVPEELRQYVADLLPLGVLSKAPAAEEPAETADFSPNEPITRSDYARWLLATNNRFYADQPDRRIRIGVATANPAFRDVPTAHPDFVAIQGLAEAGLIPSALTGNSTAVNFRPEDPLTRKDLVLWKVPLDTRQGLPITTVEAIGESWGFQDAANIEPLALRAVAADHQLGEFSNIRRAFGYTTLFQPDRAVTEAEAAAALWRFGTQTEGISAAQVRQADTAPAAAAPSEPQAQTNRPAQPRPGTSR